MKALVAGLMVFLAGCASYSTPGGPARLEDIDRVDVAEAASRKPSPNFPARLAVARVQAPDYRSYSADAYGTGRFSVVTAQELMTDAHFQRLGGWPSVAGVAPINRLLLPASLDSLDDLRISAAKIQADILLVYTVDTQFRVQGRGYGPLTAISLGLVPDRDAHVTATVSALFTDVRTGFVYGVAEATTKATGLTNVWSSSDTVDRKRLEAEQEAFTLFITEAEKTWAGIVQQFGSPPAT